MNSCRRTPIWPVTVSASLALSAGCTFNLGTVRSPSGKTADQQQSDILYCKDQAHLAVSSTGRQTGDFLLGVTIVGAPVAYELDKSKQREVYGTCMRAKGYTVIPPSGELTAVTPSPTSPAVSSIPGIENLKLDLPAGFERRAPTDVSNLDFAINRTADVGVVLSAEDHRAVTDVQAFVISHRASQMSRLDDAVPSEVSTIEVGDRKAYRFEVHGTLKGLHIVYLETIIEGTDQLVLVNAWTSAANFETQSVMMRELAARARGIQ